MKEIIATSKAPAAIGPYSQAVKSGGFLFVSGQIPIDPDTGEQLVGSLRSQTERVLNNLRAICEAAGASLADAVKITLYVSNLDHFLEINETYAKFFPENPPARATIQVSRLPKDSGVEIDAIVALPSE